VRYILFHTQIFIRRAIFQKKNDNSRFLLGVEYELYLNDTRVYSKVSGLAALKENCKWYSSLPLGVVVSPLCESL